MIPDVASSLMAATIRIHIVWVVCGLYLAYELGYHHAKKKYNCSFCDNFNGAICSMIPYR